MKATNSRFGLVIRDMTAPELLDARFVFQEFERYQAEMEAVPAAF